MPAALHAVADEKNFRPLRRPGRCAPETPGSVHEGGGKYKIRKNKGCLYG